MMAILKHSTDQQAEPVGTLRRIGEGLYVARSTSREGGEYRVQVSPDGGSAVCDCPGALTHGACWHLSEALRGEDEARSSRTVALAPFPVHPPTTLLPTKSELEVMGLIARTIVMSPGYAIPAALDRPDKAVAVMLAGRELGVPPMASFRHIFVVNGRTEPDAQVMTGLVQHYDPTARFEWEERSHERCVVTLHRAGRAAIRSEYTLEDARRSGQFKEDGRGPWKLYTRDMLAWAAVKRACRLGAPEIINGIVGHQVTEAGEVLEHATPLAVANLLDPPPSREAVQAGAAKYDEILASSAVEGFAAPPSNATKLRECVVCTGPIDTWTDTETGERKERIDFQQELCGDCLETRNTAAASRSKGAEKGNRP